MLSSMASWSLRARCIPQAGICSIFSTVGPCSNLVQAGVRLIHCFCILPLRLVRNALLNRRLPDAISSFPLSLLDRWVILGHHFHGFALLHIVVFHGCILHLLLVWVASGRWCCPGLSCSGALVLRFAAHMGGHEWSWT